MTSLFLRKYTRFLNTAQKVKQDTDKKCAWSALKIAFSRNLSCMFIITYLLVQDYILYSSLHHRDEVFYFQQFFVTVCKLATSGEEHSWINHPLTLPVGLILWLNLSARHTAQPTHKITWFRKVVRNVSLTRQLVVFGTVKILRMTSLWRFQKQQAFETNLSKWLLNLKNLSQTCQNDHKIL